MGTRRSCCRDLRGVDFARCSGLLGLVGRWRAGRGRRISFARVVGGFLVCRCSRFCVLGFLGIGGGWWLGFGLGLVGGCGRALCSRRGLTRHGGGLLRAGFVETILLGLDLGRFFCDFLCRRLGRSTLCRCSGLTRGGWFCGGTFWLVGIVFVLGGAEGDFGGGGWKLLVSTLASPGAAHLKMAAT